MSEKNGPRSRLEEQVVAAERFLVLRNFGEADRVSRYVMQKAPSVPDSSQELQRAAYVFVQALFELNRFGESLALLQEHYGGLERVEFDVLMLWAALALDARMQPEAALALGAFLAKHTTGAMQQPGAEGAALQLTSQQLAMAAHMYAIEVLAREGRQYKKAESWLRGEGAHALGPAQSESMLAQLEEMRGGAEGTPAQPSTPTNAPSRLPQQRIPDSPPKAAPAAATPVRSEEHAASSLPWQAAAGGDPVQPNAPPTGSAERGAGGSSSGAAATPEDSCEAAESAGAAGQSASWTGLGQVLSASVRLRMAQLWQHMQSGEALGEWDQSQLAAAALGGALLLYAAIAERRALGLGLRRVGGGVVGSVWEVFRLATTLNPNPVAAAVAGQRYA